MTPEKAKIQYNHWKYCEGLTDADIAKWFGYKNANSFRNSARYIATIKGILKVLEQMAVNEEEI